MPAATSLRSLRVRVFALALALLLVWPGWIAVNNGLSGLYARPAIDYLEEKRFDAYVVNEAEWSAIASSVTQAETFMPDNPRYLAALGWLHQLKLTLFADQLDAQQTATHAQAATDYFQRAIEHRPTWSYYWGNLALEHHRHGNFADAQYGNALANAARFGPWKNDTQRLVADLGSESWALLSPRAQREVLLSVERGLHRQPGNTLRIVDALGAWPAMCAANAALRDVEQPHFAALCSQIERNPTSQ